MKSSLFGISGQTNVISIFSLQQDGLDQINEGLKHIVLVNFIYCYLYVKPHAHKISYTAIYHTFICHHLLFRVLGLVCP